MFDFCQPPDWLTAARDWCTCQFEICSFIVSGANKYLKDVYYSLHMSKLLMFWLFQNFKEISPLLYFVILSCDLVLYSGSTCPVWFCYMFKPSVLNKSCIKLPNTFLICNHLVQIPYSMILHESTCALFCFCPLLCDGGILHCKVFSSDRS